MTSNRTSLDRTAETELLITRTFTAPPDIVFDAWTKPEFVKRWWAPASRGVVVVECEIDLRVGGAYRYVLEQSKGRIAFSGKYNEVMRPSRLVYTNRFEPVLGKPMPGEVLVTVSFDEHNGGTKLISREVYPSKEVLDGVLQTGMESGMRETFEQLDKLMSSLVKG
jgi:uncharacterized protein YndB with AHSA1/START domain